MLPFHPVWDVYYYTAPGKETGKGTRPLQNTLRDSRLRARLEELYRVLLQVLQVLQPAPGWPLPPGLFPDSLTKWTPLLAGFCTLPDSRVPEMLILDDLMDVP